ncbi:hypothetical protein G6O69_22305 [Pseudenhygromyxa sp. WMMC2535]|uniref:MYXO-CTERM sorting domain-containing protein n=1 Tax=Pseudenhygromyxa sp. WMMC2535 TaxID=2712867 RepID=UPI001594F340|nr:MYXO-CTERM sorting domain-containing protein [Pseudenhygromyxa sp. WMMC2535]NVB40589.1 hypothetical protein [Pseudenhygromyxa sp. WMMC2535]
MNHEEGTSISACVCMSEEEFESGYRDDELADELMAECLAFSALYGYDWDECEENRYGSEYWLAVEAWWDDEDLDFAYDGLECAPPDEAEGCAVEEPGHRLGLLMLGLPLLVLGLRRRE